MSTVVFVIRALLANALFLPPRRLYQALFDRDVGRNHQLQVGDCRFWGPAEFSAVCQSAMDDLRATDKTLFTHLTSSGMITFWLTSPTLKRRTYNKVSRFYHLPPDYYSWGAKGVLAFIVAVYFDETYTACFLGVPVETPSSYAAYRKAVVAWLTARDYPLELVTPFLANPPNQAMQRTAGRSAL